MMKGVFCIESAILCLTAADIGIYVGQYLCQSFAMPFPFVPLSLVIQGFRPI